MSLDRIWALCAVWDGRYNAAIERSNSSPGAWPRPSSVGNEFDPGAAQTARGPADTSTKGRRDAR